MTERSLLPVYQSLESGQARLRAVVDHALDGLITMRPSQSDITNEFNERQH